MSITRVGTATASATTVTAPAHLPGDIIVYWAMHGGATTIPTLPSGIVGILTKTESTAVALGTRMGYQIATGIGAITSASQNTSTGVWTTAANSLVAGQEVQITGSLPGGFSANTNYWVLSTNLTSTTCELSATQGGSVKLPTTSVSTTFDTDPTGTWTNASEMIVAVYRPSAGYVLGIGQSASSNSTTDTINYPALSPMGDANSGNSWVLGLVAASNLTQTLTTAFAGMTSVTSVAGASYAAALADTNAGVSSWASTNQTVTGTAGKSVSATVELVLLPATAATSLTSHVYQHIKGGGNPFANNAGSTTPFQYTIPVNWTSGAGNTLVLEITYDGGIAAPTVVGAVNGTFTAGPTALGGTNNQDTRSYYVQGITAGQETITVTFAVSTRSFGVDAITELYGVATSGGLAGSSSVAFSTTLGAGSFTPTNNNATGGNFIWASFVQAEQIPVGTTPAIYAGASFTLLAADTGWNDSGGDGENFAKAQEGFLQTTSAAINPSIAVMGQGADHWNSIAMAFKVSAGSGTPPPANYIAGVSFLSTTHYPAGGGNYSFQISRVGNLAVIQSPDPNLSSTINVSDDQGHSWFSDGTAKPAFWYWPGATANPNGRVFITGGGTDTTLSFRFIDIVGADPTAPFDSAINVGDSIGAVTTYTPTNKISPSNTNGIVLYGIGIGLGPGLGITAPTGAVWQYPTFTGELDSDLAVNADIGAYYVNTASGSITATFTITSNAGNSSSGGIIAFKWAAPAVAPQGIEGASRIGGMPGIRRGTPFSRLHAMLGYSNASTSVMVALTGVKITSSAGSLIPSTAVPLIGKSAAFASGTVKPATTKALTGSAVTSAAGTVKPAISKALLGSMITAAAGTLGNVHTIPLVGALATFSTGTVVASTGGNVTVALVGQAAMFHAGTLTPAISKALVGIHTGFTGGNLGSDDYEPLVGQKATFSAGTVKPSITVAQTGQRANFSAGTVKASPMLALTGKQATFAAGSFGHPAISVPLVSAVALFRAGQVVPPGGLPATGGVQSLMPGHPGLQGLIKTT